MQVYIVGGFIRDLILEKNPNDRDFIIVGATPKMLLNLGFTQVGNSFPVFLNDDGEEFALARTERKTGAGYTGFETDYNPHVTLEEDLLRRDLTCNSISLEVDSCIFRTGELITIGDYIDPYGGIQDLKNKILRQTSDAFIEDPLRVLRTARFAARYNFTIHSDTLQTMCKIVEDGELAALPMERVFAEFKKVMMEDRPDIFFNVLNEVGAFELYFEELCVWDTKELKKAIKHGVTFEERVCVLMLGFTVAEVNAMLTRIKAPNDLMNMVLWTIRMEELMEDIDFGCIEPFTNKYLWERLNSLNAWRNLEKIKAVFKVFLIIGDEASIVLDTIIAAVHLGSKIGFDDLDEDTRDLLVGKEIGEAISQKRLELLKELNLFPS